MPAPLILAVQEASIAYGSKVIFEKLSFNIHQGNKICLIGKNGSGKTTLMKILANQIELDSGEKWQIPNLSISHLRQEIIPKPDQTIKKFIWDALPSEKQNDEHEYLIDMVTSPLLLDPNALMTELSGGQLRRAALAQSLVEEPDILLLDEPTNHLDLAGIEWLENYLKRYRGTLLCISHDKMFISNITDKVFWLDRGIVRICPKGFKHFQEWQDTLLDQERRELENRERSLAIEEEWANRGVKARRKRNVRRVAEARSERKSLDEAKRSYRRAINKIELKPLKNTDSSNMIVEMFNVCKAFTRDAKTNILLDKFNYRIMRGDRIGLLGQNGSGKTSFLKMLLGELKPDSGKIKLGDNVKISYFDQKRRDLDPTESIRKTLSPSGSDYIQVGSKNRHVCGYLKDFMFDPKIANDCVSTLSGGQKNRLMLAKTLANPGSVLILDEPTNDLDMETLEILESVLCNYKGTLIVVSHDRDFLDQVINKILAFKGNGEIDEHIGGYSDYLENISIEKSTKETNLKNKKHQDKSNNSSNKVSYKHKFEHENLPNKIKLLETEIKELELLTHAPDFYDQDHDKVAQILEKLGHKTQVLEDYEMRWLELEELINQSN
ncbi:MAG: ABC-F family ATP-binding cassette domain-containing protein [Rickettsiales bacterium]|nr:ABC-F family ATP-binding cassette domain-containing protein [Rickettsiales bacterium]